MLKSIVNKYLKAFLGEIFLNAPSAHLSIAADLFSDSNLRLDDLTFRPDIFDINLQPFRLISGHLGTLSIEGITELALAGKVKFTAENIFLLFRVDTTSDAEHIQTLKKIRLEMQSGELTGSIFKELLKRIQGFPADKEADVGKRRKVVFKALDTVFKGLSFVLKNIHIRFETHDPVNSASIPQFLSMGIIIPTIRFMPSSAAAVGTGSVAGARNMSQAQSQNLGDTILLAVRGFHCYCDYGRDSYTINGSDDASIAKEFMNRWKVEKHNLVVHPAELEISISLSMKRKSGLLLPKITVKSPEMRFSIDEKQLHTFRDISEAVVFAHKRFQQLLRVQKIFRNGFPLPRVFEVGGVRILPHLLVRNNPYPAEYRLSDETMKAGKQKASSTSTLVTFMRERVGDRWAKMMWLHVGRLVIHDLRLQRPFGRWVEIAKLASIRRKYCFIYSKLLKMSKETGNFVFDVQSNVRAETLRLLFEYEMQLPVRTILLFRSLGIMVAHVEHFNFKRKQQHAKSTAASANRASISTQSFERTSISWTDILRIFIEYNEAKRETAFHRFDRKNFEDDTLNGAYYDDASTSKASDDGSVYSYSLQTRAPVAQTISNVFSPPDKVLSKPSAAAFTFSAQHHSTSSPQPIASSFRSSVKTVSSMQSSALKIFGSIGVIGGESKSTYHSHNSNEGDIKISSKFDLSVFSDFFSSLTEPEEKFVEIPTEKKVTEGGAVNAPVKDFTKIVLNDYNLGGQSPALSVIVEAVQWALLRNQQSVVLMPPDMNVNFDKISGELRSSYLPPPAVREKIASAFMTSVSFNVTVSQSSHQSKGKGSSESPIKSLRGFASLSGALLQFRLVSKQLSVSVYADRAVAEAVAKDHAAVIAQYESLIAGKSSGKGTMLSTGLPAYPASQNKSSSEKSQSSSSGRASVKKQGNDKESLDGTEESLVEDAANEIEEINRAIFTPNAARTTEISGVKVQPGKTIFQSVKDMESVDGDGDMSLHFRSESQLPLLNMKGDECGSMDGATDEELLLMLEYQNGKLFGPSVDAKMHPVGDADAPKNILYNSGTTVLDSSNMMKKIVQSKPKKDIVPESSVDARIAEKEDKESSPANADKAATGPVEKVFVFSVPEENFLVFCVILDLDDKGEGAADVQLQLGGLKGDLSRVTLSAIAHPLLLSTSHNALKSLQQLRKLRPLLPSLFADGSDNSRKERALIIDRTLRIPLVSLYFHASTSRNRKKITKTAIGTAVESGSPKEAHASSLTFSPTHSDEDYISSDGDTLNGDDESELEGESVDLPQNVQNLLQEVREDGLHAQHVQIRKRQAALYNKNIHQWAGLLDTFLPRVVSVCVRMSPASIECVESSVIRDFIFSKIHDVVNRASQRLSSASQRADSHMLSGALQLLSTLFMRQKLGDNKASIRRWGSKRQHAQNMREDLLFVVSSSSQKNSSSPASQQEQRPLSLARSLVSIPSFDLILTKAAVPYPAVDIHLLGLQLKLPVTDETLCHLLALLLGHVFPFYY